MGLLYRLGLTALAMAAVGGSWLWTSAGVAQADGGLLGSALSSDGGQSEDEDDGGLLNPAVETVDPLAGGATETVGAVSGSEQTAPEEDRGAGAAKAAESEEEPASEPAGASEGLLGTAAPVTSPAPASTDSATEAMTGLNGAGASDRSNGPSLDVAAPLAEVLEPVSNDEPAITSLTQTVDRAIDNASASESTPLPVAEDGEALLAPATGLADRAVEETLGAAPIDRTMDEAEVTGIVDKAVEHALASATERAESTVVEPLEPLLTAVSTAAEPLVAATAELVETTVVEPLEPLLTTVDDALEPVTEPLAALVDDVAQPLAPVVQPALSLTDEAIDPAAPLAPVTLDGLVLTETTPLLASSETRGTLPGGESIAWDATQAVPDAFEPAARILVPAERVNQRHIVSGPEAAGRPAMNLKATDEPEPASARSGTSNGTYGPAAWLSAILSAERSGPSSIGGLSAVLAGLAALFIAPAIAARALVAMPAPRSPVYLPVYPPD